MSKELPLYSIQQTYIITLVSTSEKKIVTCDQRIDVPTIESFTEREAVVLPGGFLKIIPCIELAGKFLGEFNLEFETNEGVTVLPILIEPGQVNPVINPYRGYRFAFVLPRGATGVKSCKIIRKATGKEVQHNLTFGIMPPPYNYDNALFSLFSYITAAVGGNLDSLEVKLQSLKLTTKTPSFTRIYLPKGEGKQTINIKDGALFYETSFVYPLSEESTIHKPKITFHGGGRDQVYTLSLNKTTNTVSIDLFTGMIRVCDVNGEIIQQFMLSLPYHGFETLSFENFDDIDPSNLFVDARGGRVE